MLKVRDSYRQGGATIMYARPVAILLALAISLDRSGLAPVGEPHEAEAFPASTPTSSATQNCVKAIANLGQLVLKARLKECETCDERQASGQEADTVDCSAYDPAGKVEKAIIKGKRQMARSCTDENVGLLNLGACGKTVASAQACIASVHDLNARALCGAMHGTITLDSSATAAAKCQSGLARWIQKNALTVLKEEGKCFDGVLKGEESTDTCTLTLPKIEDSVAKAQRGLLKSCSDQIVREIGLCDPAAQTVADAIGRIVGQATCAGGKLTALQYGTRSPTCERFCATPVSRAKASQLVANEAISGSTSSCMQAFVSPTPLQLGDVLSAMYSPTELINEPSWFAWVDDSPQSMFAHRTRFMRVSAIGGQVDVEERLWWPIINGESPWEPLTEDRANDAIYGLRPACIPESMPAPPMEEVLARTQGRSTRVAARAVAIVTVSNATSVEFATHIASTLSAAGFEVHQVKITGISDFRSAVEMLKLDAGDTFVWWNMGHANDKEIAVPENFVNGMASGISWSDIRAALSSELPAGVRAQVVMDTCQSGSLLGPWGQCSGFDLFSSTDADSYANANITVFRTASEFAVVLKRTFAFSLALESEIASEAANGVLPKDIIAVANRKMFAAPTAVATLVAGPHPLTNDDRCGGPAYNDYDADCIRGQCVGDACISVMKEPDGQPCAYAGHQGTCRSGICAVCGDGIAEPSERCDASDDSMCPGRCQPDCTCGPCPNYVRDPGFELGGGGWVFAGNAGPDSHDLPHSGGWAAYVNAPIHGVSGSVSQSIDTLTGHSYLVSFWLASNCCAAGHVSVKFGDTEMAWDDLPQRMPFTRYEFPVMGAGASQEFVFSGQDLDGTYFIDDVAITDAACHE